MSVDSAEYRQALESAVPDHAPRAVQEDDLFLLIFTSGSTGLPKAVRCTHGRFARTGAHVARVTELGPGDIVYAPLPFFHTSALFTGLASALTAGVPIATRPKFSASNTIREIADIGATVLTYTGKVLNYILAVPEQPGDANTRLRLAIGNEASERDIARVLTSVRLRRARQLRVDRRSHRDPARCGDAARFAGDSRRHRDRGGSGDRSRMSAGGPRTRRRAAQCRKRRSASSWRPHPVIGSRATTTTLRRTVQRLRDGWYWSGDLAYRTADGWLFFAGRSNEWLRVDGENFAAAPVEAIVARFPGARSVAVYAVPDDPVGDRVMVGSRARRGHDFRSGRRSTSSWRARPTSVRSGSRRSCASPKSSPNSPA